MCTIGEMATWMPMESAFMGHADRFCHPALGFAVGWMYVSIACEATLTTQVPGQVSDNHAESVDCRRDGHFLLGGHGYSEPRCLDHRLFDINRRAQHLQRQGLRNRRVLAVDVQDICHGFSDVAVRYHHGRRKQ